MEISAPLDTAELVKLPYGDDVFICPTTLHRWISSGNLSWERDYYGEAEWEKMASYVNQSYEEVAGQELQYAIKAANTQ